ncbi:PAAR domain-containing protein [Burkholderia ubonensis]|uniref:PAAR domain-containing protein n=1 Tax=Burkholderia ubonensis TaxID=101571 RepID=UPI000A939D36|nr:PAAR domain-containing protein [Burkholderia ubonensis]
MVKFKQKTALREGHLSRGIICQGDTTSHGGKVLEGNPTATLDGRPISGVGHMVACPQCKGTFPILPDLLDRRYPHVIDGRNTAVAGMRTACGATLIASQSNSTISDEGDGHASTGAAVATAATALPLSPTPTLCLECLIAAAKSGATTIMRG